MSDLDVAVIGAGISGLAVAYRLQGAGRNVEVFEAGDSVGGRMRTLRRDGFVIDEGAETLSTHGYASTWQLIRDIGFEDVDILSVPSVTAVWRRGKAHAGVGHWRGGVTGMGLSARGRLRLARATGGLLPSASEFDVLSPASSPLGLMTVAQFGRRTGAEVFDFVLQPAVGGAWGWDPERSCAAPMLATMFSTRGLMGWRTYRDGMDTLARRTADHLSVHRRHRLTEVKADQDGVRLVFEDGATCTAKAAVLAVPAPLALELDPSMPDSDRQFVASATYTSMIRVSCLLDRPLELATAGVYALLVPEREDRLLSGITFEHNKAAGRVPAGAGLVTLLSSRPATRELINCDDAEIVRPLLARAEDYLPGLARACYATVVHRFEHAAPEATPAAVAQQRAFVSRPLRRVEYAGDWIYQRPTSESAVQSSRLAVSRLLG